MISKVAALFAFTALLGISGCVTGPMASSPAEETYLSDLAKEPFEFDLPKDQGEDAMGRAQVFIAKYSSMKLQTATPNVVDTYNVSEGTILTTQQYGYRVTRANIGGNSHFVVECFNGLEGAMFDSAHELPARNARMLIRYMKNGSIEYPNLIAK